MIRISALAMACGLICTGAYEGAAAPPPPQEWEVEVAPYAWLAMATGRVDTRRGSQRFTIDAHEVLSSFDLGVFGSVKGRWRRFVFLTDVAWAKLSDDAGLGDTEVRFDVTQKLGWFEALGGYRVYERPGGLFGTPSPTEGQIFSVDLLAGLTYSWIDLRLKVSREPFLGFLPPEQRTFEPTRN